MPLDMHKELLHFLTQHIDIHGADHRSERYVNQCCDLWKDKYGKTADQVRQKAIQYWEKNK
jgi:hypothetical protein